jgi:hypothetical protein
MTGSTGCHCWCIRVPSYDLPPQWAGQVTHTYGTCPTCGQPVRKPVAYCTCDHLELGHDLNAKGVRTACFYIDGPKGTRCECKLMQPRT